MNWRVSRTISFLFAGANILATLSNASDVNEKREASITHSSYSGQIAQTYDYRFGEAHPFLPSNIQTSDGTFIDPKAFQPPGTAVTVTKKPMRSGVNPPTPTQTERRGI